MKEDFSLARFHTAIYSFLRIVIWNRHTRYIFWVLCFVFLFLWLLNSPPRDFPARTIITIEAGGSLADISQFLKDQNVIRSELLFEIFVITRGGERRVMAGDYFFVKSNYISAVARRLTEGEFGITPIRVTIPEGSTIYEVAKILNKNISNFNEALFLDLAKEKEGYLFPDTYFFLPNSSPEEIISIMTKNFESKTSSLLPTVEEFGKSLKDVVIMASIIEREVMTPEDRRMVSGILWKRIAIGMPLQVDAAFIYVNGTTTPGLALKDLKIDSPYNTYLYKGLPIGPIGNPGLDAIRATLEPKSSPNLYYLSDKEGVTHYARTFEEHKENKEKYLR